MADTVKTHPLEKWRKSKGLTLDAAAVMVGTTRPVWYNWEKGRRRPAADFIPKLRALTGLSADTFFPDDPESKAA